jgi:hypothetical protein
MQELGPALDCEAAATPSLPVIVPLTATLLEMTKLENTMAPAAIRNFHVDQGERFEESWCGFMLTPFPEIRLSG